ncbi:MAG: hypothetical protein M8352_05875 [ANME-2 cluster archaeon]|nr:hypothetical protein [ANME-2 cluster archaeon]MDF1531375.1 hypothetical protein [ANME-2 cluster archaeon]
MAATLLPYHPVVSGTAIHSRTPGQPDQSKSTCQSPTSQGRAEQTERGTWQSEDEGAEGELKKGWGLPQLKTLRLIS